MSKYALEDEDNTNDSEFPLLEPGTYQMVLTKVEVKEFTNQNPKFGEIGAVNKRLQWIFDEEESGAIASMLTGTSRRGQKAKLPPVLKALNGGRELTADALQRSETVEAFIDSKIGEEFLCQVSQKVTSDGKVFNIVDSVSPLPKKKGAPTVAKKAEVEIPDWVG